MTFGEAIKDAFGCTDELETISSIIDIINELREEYMPTIEMTKNQYLFITGEHEKESVVEAVANLTVDDIIKEKFHTNFWSPLTQEQVVQAWLHPETIKVVD